MREIPLEVIASWPQPNYTNPEDRGPAVKIVPITLLSIVTVLVAIRVYTRRFITKGFGWDDVLILLAYLSTTAFTVSGLVAVYHFGWGLHVWDVRPRLFEPSLKLTLTNVVLFDLSTSFTKLSMLALVYRIAVVSSKRLKIAVLVLMSVIAVNCVAFLLISLLQCRPLNIYWTLKYRRQGCINEKAHVLSAGIINTATDFLVVLLSLAITRLLQKGDGKLSRRQVVVVYALFAAGFLASGAGAARTYFTWYMTDAADYDTTWHAWLTWLLSCIELFVGIIAASLPATKPFFARYLPQVIGQSTMSLSRSLSLDRRGSSTTRGGRVPEKQGSAADTYEVRIDPRNSLSTIQEADDEESQRGSVSRLNVPGGRAPPGYPGDSLRQVPSRGSDISTRNLTEARSFI